MDWRTQMLAKDVPQCLLDAAQRGVGHAAAIEARHLLPAFVDRQWRLADQLLLENFEHR